MEEEEELERAEKRMIFSPGHATTTTRTRTSSGKKKTGGSGAEGRVKSSYKSTRHSVRPTPSNPGGGKSNDDNNINPPFGGVDPGFSSSAFTFGQKETSPTAFGDFREESSASPMTSCRKDPSVFEH